jgi:hypothetical protein
VNGYNYRKPYTYNSARDNTESENMVEAKKINGSWAIVEGFKVLATGFASKSEALREYKMDLIYRA